MTSALDNKTVLAFLEAFTIKEKIQMEKQTFTIPKISCGHCVNAIKTELDDLEGIVSVAGDPQSKEIVVEFNPPATEAAIKATLEEINYPAA